MNRYTLNNLKISLWMIIACVLVVINLWIGISFIGGGIAFDKLMMNENKLNIVKE